MQQPAAITTTASLLSVTVLLVDDQIIVGESIRRMLAAEEGIAFHFCQDPAKAVAMANEVKPTVILQDLVMPDIDGLQLVKFFRANKATREVPLIVLSSKEDPTIKSQAFAYGANDYLVKWPDKLEVVARIRYHSRGYIALLERNEAYRELAESQRLLAAEIEEAARYVRSLLPTKLKGSVDIDWILVPSTQLAGDMFGYHWLDDDHLAIFLLDVSGHGVGSALLAVSAANVLSNRSLPDTDFRDPGRVLTRLNEVFQMEKQNEKYFTIWYGVYHRSERTLTYSNGGHPDALLVTGQEASTARVISLPSRGLGIGMMEGVEFDSVVVPIGPYARLLIFSDGVFEIDRPEGGMWTFSEFIEFVSGLLPDGNPIIERLLKRVRQLHESDMLDDDFSMLDLQFS